MSIASLARSERLELCDLMLEVGPDAPTLNEGWDVLDLAAHLVAREHDLWGGPGIILGGPLASLTEMARKRRRSQGLDRLVAKLRRGEPVWWKPAPRGVQLNEYFIHHEDVRRANGRGPRRDRPDLDVALARLVRASARLLLKDFSGGLDVVWQGGVLYRHGQEPRAVLSGPPSELLLYLSGRRVAAEITLQGDPTVVELLENTGLEI